MLHMMYRSYCERYLVRALRQARGTMKQMNRPPSRRGSVAFLLAQVGAAAAARFGERAASIDISRPQAGLLRALAASEPTSQQALATHLSLGPSRLVVLIDELEQRKLVERRPDPSDRRVYALGLTPAGRELGERLTKIAREHDQEFCAALDDGERQRLRLLLEKLADAHGLTPGVHPGYRTGAAESERKRR
jgi:DNA-binding MarR family transcriptional regulator